MYKMTWILILFFVGAVHGQCNYRQYINPGSKYTIQSPNYPNLYQPQVCSWTSVTRSDAVVRLNCYLVNLGPGDYLYVTTTNGNSNNGKYYYDVFETSGNMITMELLANSWRGGVFKCDVWAEQKPSTECDCGYSFRTRIVGGVDAGIHEFPSAAGLIDKDGEFFCGATIIAKRVALTAAHAVINRDPNDYYLVVGEHDLSTRGETNVTRYLPIVAFISHEKYVINKGLYDIALVITGQDIQFSARVGPACLPFNSQNYLGEYLEVVGWGLTSFGGAQPNVLQKTIVQVIPPKRCEDEYRETFSDAQQLCTFLRGRDACQKDSGGPLYYRNQSNYRMYVVGIVSMGKLCGDKYPSVNERVTYFMEWIESQVPSILK